MKGKRIGFIVLVSGRASKGRITFNGALTPCRPGEAPDLFERQKDVDFILRVTQQEFGYVPIQVVPIKFPLVQCRRVRRAA